MRRLIPLVALAIALTACSGSGETTTDTAAATVPPSTTAAPTATTAPAPTTTTAVPTSTTAAPGTTATADDEPTAFEPIAGTPPAVFDTFTSRMVVSMRLDDTEFEVISEGSWTADALECTMTIDLGGFGLSQSVVATENELWLDDGSGFEESGLFGPAQDVMSGCPASPLFWADFAADDFGRATGETEDFAGRSAVKIDLTELLDFAGGIGVVPDLDDAMINSMVMWIDEETNVVLGLFADIEVDPAALGDIGIPTGEPTGGVAMVMDLRVEQVNDPAVSVEQPEA
jgi:hypothetical protein